MSSYIYHLLIHDRGFETLSSMLYVNLLVDIPEHVNHDVSQSFTVSQRILYVLLKNVECHIKFLRHCVNFSIFSFATLL